MKTIRPKGRFPRGTGHGVRCGGSSSGVPEAPAAHCPDARGHSSARPLVPVRLVGSRLTPDTVTSRSPRSRIAAEGSVSAMFGEAQGRRPRTLRALLAAAVGVIVLIGTPATAQGTPRGPVNPGSDPVTVTVSSRSQVTNTTLTVSFPHGDRSRLSTSLTALLHRGG